MNQIINIRGCNGSGKTHTVRKFLDILPSKSLGGKPGKPLGYLVDARDWGIFTPLYVVGSYENACGGADTIRTQEEVADRTIKAYRMGHVLVEGLLMSKSSDGGHAAPILRDHNAIFGFLDTPWNICLERVLKRRASAGNTKEFDPNKTMKSAYEQCHRSYELLSQSGGYDVRWINHKDAIGEVVNLLTTSESMPF